MKKSTIIVILSLLTKSIFSMNEPNDQWDGSNYQKNSSPQYLAAIEFLKQVKNISQYTKILDVGCGSGDITATISDLTPKSTVIGIDASESMINQANSNYKNNENLIFCVSDAQKMELKEMLIPIFHDFDVVFSFSCFHWIQDKKAALCNIASKLKNGGHFYMTMAARINSNNILLKAFLATALSEKWFEHFKEVDLKQQYYPLSEQELKELLNEAGLNPIFIKSVERRRKFTDFEAFENWLQAWIIGFPAVASLKKKMQLEYAHDVVTNYKEIMTINEDGSFEHASSALLVMAAKK